MKVYFNEFNPGGMDRAYLPLVSGKLRAYAETSSEVARHYDFQPFLFRIEPVANIINEYDNPGVVAFSCMMWNEQLCLAVAREIKAKWPECLIIFGGTQVPHAGKTFLDTYDFVDVCVINEGEEPFKKILEAHMVGNTFEGIPNTFWRHPNTGKLIHNTESFEFAKDLDIYPSPYLNGYYNDLVKDHPEIQFQGIIETNRGCPFLCTFCYWGKGGLSRKYRYFGIERTRQEFEWLGQFKIDFIYNADSNFGMHRRDEELADIFVDTKKRHGFPEKIINLYGKNTDDRIFNIVKKLYAADMHKGIGLSRQSMDPAALEATKRANIKLEIYDALQRKFEQEGIPTFCELLLGLPGETYDSFVKGVDVLLETSPNSQLMLIMAEVYPNTEMGEPEYQKKHGMDVKRNVAYGNHSFYQDDNQVVEYIDYIVGTRTMPNADWRRAGIIAWATMTLTGLRIGYYLARYLKTRYGIRAMEFIQYIAENPDGIDNIPIWQSELDSYAEFMDQIYRGKGRVLKMPEYGSIYWAVEETSFLRITENREAFFSEMHILMQRFLQNRGHEVYGDELAEVVSYQRLRVPSCKSEIELKHQFEFNMPEYLENPFGEEPVELHRKPTKVAVIPQNYNEEKVRFAKERVLWARRGGQLEQQLDWEFVT